MVIVHYFSWVLPQFQECFLDVTSTQVKHVGQCTGVSIRKYEKHCRAQFDFMQCKHTFLWLFLKSCCGNSSYKLEFIFLLHMINLLVKEKEGKKLFLSTLIIIPDLSSVTQMNYDELCLQMHGLGEQSRMLEAQGQTVRQHWRRKHALFILIPVQAPLCWFVIQMSVGTKRRLKKYAKNQCT